MNTIKTRIYDICEGKAFQNTTQEIFDGYIDGKKIDAQECDVFDYKRDVPKNFSDEYGFGIIKLIISFYNTYGGIVFIGVNKSGEIEGVSEDIDIENVNHYLNVITGHRILCTSKRIYIDESDKFLSSIIVRKRSEINPAKINKKTLNYKIDSIFIRKDHEVCIADSRDLSFLYSRRHFDAHDRYPVHKALPPSPATIRDFVGRYKLEIRLWDWLLCEDQPRFYLFGDGGAGKSTLAYEFSRAVSECGGDLLYSNNDPIDYVVYLSAKETELNTITGKISSFITRDFSDTITQFKKILLLSGIENDENIEKMDYDSTLKRLKVFFNEYSGLIIIDDIDALTRNSVDSGEETLLLAAIRASKKTKILYTLRFEPHYAKTSSEKISGLTWDEYSIFIDSCCKQFNIKSPGNEDKSKIFSETNHLPLLIETICGLRRDCSDYENAISMFKEKGGDEARNYIYQREFFKIQKTGITKYVLICLSYVGVQLSFSELSAILPYAEESIRDSITELSSIFLTTSTGDNGETLYSASRPSIPFLTKIYLADSSYDSVKRCVDNYKKIPSSLSREEFRILTFMDKCIRIKSYGSLINEVKSSVPTDSPLRAEPRFHSLLGQAYALINPPNYQEAVSCFKEAKRRKYFDIYMLRQWFFVCMQSDVEKRETESVCKIVINDSNMSPRYVSEFYCKLGDYFFNISYRDRFSNTERALRNCAKSIDSYLDGIAAGGSVPEIDTNMQISWLKKVLGNFMLWNDSSLEAICDIIARECGKSRDINLDVAMFLSASLDFIKSAPRLNVGVNLNIIYRCLGQIRKHNRYREVSSGIYLIIKNMERLHGEINNLI